MLSAPALGLPSFCTVTCALAAGEKGGEVAVGEKGRCSYHACAAWCWRSRAAGHGPLHPPPTMMHSAGQVMLLTPRPK